MGCNGIIAKKAVNGENHRRSARCRVNTLAYINLGSNNGGTLIDVSEGGLSFHGIKPLEIGQILPIGFTLPGVHQSFNAVGQIAWLNDSKKGGGLRFVALLEHARNLLKECLPGMAPRDPAKQPVAHALSTETGTAQASQVLGGVDQVNPPSTNKSLADLLRDSSLSREAVVAAVNASRSTTTAAHSTNSKQSPRFPHCKVAAKSSQPQSSTAALTRPLTLAGDSPFGLRVERAGEDWRVRWNRNADVIAKAISANLSITDGTFQKDLTIDISELRSGSIIYTPATDVVILRLQVVTENLAHPVSESVRIVTGKVTRPIFTSSLKVPEILVRRREHLAEEHTTSKLYWAARGGLISLYTLVMRCHPNATMS